LQPGESKSVQALVEVAKEQKHAGKRGEATQLLRRAAAAAANLMNSNEGSPECELSVLAQIANEQEKHWRIDGRCEDFAIGRRSRAGSGPGMQVRNDSLSAKRERGAAGGFAKRDH